ncbi:uncharacterized protein CLUP02_01670 [Colletotrichum lupini]|uniref:Uncharacterized protein n=1 Tax=Colletotrichum lupini TaxID=145971 RepID=A0A9Q8SEG7_9PEZI|nr:uncharacterized protein CLUP02_01670 [Colletotrichum lupini]UQC75017.1 hypothetical protein CLUP02_01670 [Colletotrichum lupini]
MSIYPRCAGDVTFNTLSSNAFSEWPESIAGIICKTPPVGRNSAPHFAECCSGTVYNITSPTSSNDQVYPVSCATLCQISPEMNADNPDNPYGFSNHFMCLTDGTREPSSWEVVCATVTPPGVAWPTSFPNTPVLSWKTRSWTTDIYSRISEVTSVVESPATSPTATVTTDITTSSSSQEASISMSDSSAASTPITTASSTHTSAAVATPTGSGAAEGKRVHASDLTRLLSKTLSMHPSVATGISSPMLDLSCGDDSHFKLNVKD